MLNLDMDSSKDNEKERISDKIEHNFVSSYRDYKLREEFEREYFKFENFYCKLELTIYSLVIMSSIFFILDGIFEFIKGNMHLSSIVNIFLIFGYIAFIGFYLLRRKKRKFKLYLSDRLERLYLFEDYKQE